MTNEHRAQIAIAVLKEVAGARQRALACRLDHMAVGYIFDELAERIRACGRDFDSMIELAIEAIQETYTV
jgi:hypothetical protein